MADNVNITAGAGIVIHADEYTHTTLGAGKTQLVKLVDGTLDSDTPITVDIGVKANALRIVPANDITDATYIGDIKFGEALPAGTNAIGKLAANSGVDIGDVDILSLPAVTIAAAQTLATVTTVGTVTTVTNVVHVDDNAGALTVDWAGTAPPIGAGLEATALRVTLATDSTGIVSIDDNGGSLTVDGSVTADTELTTADLDTGAGTDTRAVVGLVGTASGGGQLIPGSSTDGLLVNLGTNNDVTVTGTVTANLSATDNAVLDAIAASDASIDGKITACNTGAVVLSSGTVTTVSTVTNLSQMGGAAIAMNGGVLGTGVQRVTLATDDDAVAHLATIAGNTTNIEMAIQIIDDWDTTHDGAASADGPQLMAAYDSTKPTAVGDGDAVRILADAYGRLLTGVEPERFQATITSADAQSATQVKAKTADRKMYILYLDVSTDTAMNIQFQDDTATPNVLKEQMYFAANGGAVMSFPPQAPLVVATNQDFDVITSAAGNISVTITGYLAP